MYKTIADYEPTYSKDIALKVGDTFNKVKEIANGWAVGTNNRTQQTGYFPFNHVQLADDKPQSEGILRRLTARKPKAPFLHPHQDIVQGATQNLEETPLPSVSKIYKVIADYEPTYSKDIALKVGDTFNKVKEIANGWAVGTNNRTQQTGYFPFNHVQLADDKPQSEGILRRLTARKPKAPFLHPHQDIVLGASQEIHKAEKTPKSLMKTASKKQETKHLEDPNPMPSTSDEIFDEKHDVGNQQFDDTERDISLETEVTPKMLSGAFVGSSNENEEDRSVLASKVVGDEPDPKITEKLFSSKKHEFRKEKAIFGIIIGVVASAILFILLSFSYSYSYELAGYIALGLGILTCIGLAISVHIRCSFALMVPSLTTSKGRTVLLAIIFGLLLTGPVDNIRNNVNRLSQSMTCSSNMIYNQTVDLKAQLTVPINNITEKFNETVNRVKYYGDLVQSAFQPIGSLISSAANTLDAIADAFGSCKDMFGSAYSSCEKEISEAKSSCKNAFSFFKKRKRRDISQMSGEELRNHLLFIRHKRALSDVCNILDFSVVCSPVSITKSAVCTPLEGIDIAATQLAKEANDLVKELKSWFEFNVFQEIGLIGSVEKLREEAFSFFSGIQADLAISTGEIKVAFSILTRLLALTLVLLFLQSYNYLRNYLQEDDYNNIYITSEFVRYDQECKKNGKPFILPLLRREKAKYVSTKSLRMNKKETAQMLIALVQIALHVIIAIVITFFDYIVYYCLYLVQKYGNVNIAVTGASKIYLAITGSGYIAQLFRSFITGLNLQNTYSSNYNFTECLPEPSLPDESMSYIIGVLYIVGVVMSASQAYSVRLKRKICAYYYPEQERQRIIFLHRKIRHDRKAFKMKLKDMRRSIKKEKEMTRELSFGNKIGQALPFSQKFFQKDLKTCLNCGTNQDSSLMFVECPYCQTDYCEQCYQSLNEVCILCDNKEYEPDSEDDEQQTDQYLKEMFAEDDDKEKPDAKKSGQDSQEALSNDNDKDNPDEEKAVEDFGGKFSEDNDEESPDTKKANEDLQETFSGNKDKETFIAKKKLKDELESKV